MNHLKCACFIITVILILTAVHAYSAIIAQTGFEVAEGFPDSPGTTKVTAGFKITDSSGDYWEGGKAGYQYAGIWTNTKHGGAQSAVFGNNNTTGQYVLVDPAGADGVGTVEFWWNTYSGSSTGTVVIQWTTDTLNGSETWTTAGSITLGSLLPWSKTTIVINQSGDVKVRWYKSAAGNGMDLDDVVISVSAAAGIVGPANGATGVQPTAILEWSAPSLYAPTGYDVYFGTNPTTAANPKVVDNALQTTYNPDPDLAFATTYYWQVDTYDGAAKQSGRPWSFTTKPEFVAKVACVGDSITYGYGIPDIGTNSYPAQLQAMLGAGYQVGNFGRSGARVSQISSNPYKGSPEYNAAIAFEPDIVFIALGINDCSVGQWETNEPVFTAHYKDLISDFMMLPSHPQVYLGTLMPVFSPPYAYPAIYANMAECTPLIQQIALGEGLPLIDLYKPLESHPECYAVDGLHPDKNGAAIIAQTVYEAIHMDVHLSAETLLVEEEGPTSDVYTIVLNGIPKQDVTVTLIPSESGQVLLKVNDIETDTVVFTPVNYNQPQTVTVTAVDDTLFEGPHSVVISHSCSSGYRFYDNVVISDISVSIADNDYYGKRVKVFLIGGQSNAAGSGLNTEYPAVYQSPQTDVEFWVGGRLPGDNVPDYNAWDRPADTAFRLLQLGSGNYQAGTHSGFEMSLGRALKEALPYDNIAIVKYGMSGSALMRGLRSSDGAGDWDSGPPAWSPGEGFNGVRYHVFKTSAVLPALQAIVDRGDMPEIAGMFWMQGETDAGNLTAANTYEASLNKLIDTVRADFSTPEMRFIIGRIRTVMGTYNATVRTAMLNVAASDPLTEWIDTDDLPVNADNVHYSAAGLVELGERFADAYLSMAPKRGDFEPDGDVDLADFSRFAEQWLSTHCGFCGQADFTSDLNVDLEDFVLFIEGWLE